jgi:hypothetical protein
MKYAYHDLSYKQFEVLVVLLCQKLLGVSVQGFSDGPDGGRDAKFVGTAELHPSTVEPWRGTTIIQAKHTNGYNKHFNETDFFSSTSASCIISMEVPRIKKLKSSDELNHYMLFANRKLAANAETEIKNYISEQCGIPKPSIYLCGTEQLELWLKRFSDVPTLADLDPLDSPLIVSPDDLSDVVDALAKLSSIVAHEAVGVPPRVSYDDKNVINNMTLGYADQLRRRYLKDTAQIQQFLADPINIDLMEKYEAVVEEFQLNIVAKRKHHQTFDDVMTHLFQLLIGRDPVLKRHKRLTRAVVFYMYWNCDIGEVGDASSKQTLAP